MNYTGLSCKFYDTEDYTPIMMICIGTELSGEKNVLIPLHPSHYKMIHIIALKHKVKLTHPKVDSPFWKRIDMSNGKYSIYQKKFL